MNILLPFDTETNGMPDWKEPSGSEKQPHIVQLAALQVDADTREVIQSMDVIVKPDGWTISPEMTDIHGITTEQALDVGISEKMAVEMFMALLADGLRVAHNTTFDNRIIRIALKRYFGDQIADEFKAWPYFCTMIKSRPIIGGKNPKLIDAYKFFTGNDLEDAHSAMPDTKACLDVYWGIEDHIQL